MQCVCCHSASPEIRLLVTRLYADVSDESSCLCPQILDENAQLIRVSAGHLRWSFSPTWLLLTVFIITGACRKHEHQRKINGMHPVRMMDVPFVCLLYLVLSLMPIRCPRYQQVLHRNLVYLVSLADPSLNLQSVLPVSISSLHTS